MTSTERMLLRLVLGLLAFWCFAASTLLVALASYQLVTWFGGAWLPATVAGLAWSKWRRQCEAEAELEQSLPIARAL